MPKSCRHVHHEVQPQQNRWRGGDFKGVDPAQVFCRDCKVWLFEKPVNWDLVPKNATARREARIDDSQAGRRSAQPAVHPGGARRANTG